MTAQVPAPGDAAFLELLSRLEAAGYDFVSPTPAVHGLVARRRVLSATVTRRTRSGDILGPDECVPVDIALKAMTLWAAWQHYEDDRKGSLAVGKLADLALLDANPMTIDPDKLAGIKVQSTWKDGREVWRR